MIFAISCLRIFEDVSSDQGAISMIGVRTMKVGILGSGDVVGLWEKDSLAVIMR